MLHFLIFHIFYRQVALMLSACPSLSVEWSVVHCQKSLKLQDIPILLNCYVLDDYICCTVLYFEIRQFGQQYPWHLRQVSVLVHDWYLYKTYWQNAFVCKEGSFEAVRNVCVADWNVDSKSFPLKRSACVLVNSSIVTINGMSPCRLIESFNSAQYLDPARRSVQHFQCSFRPTSSVRFCSAPL